MTRVTYFPFVYFSIQEEDLNRKWLTMNFIKSRINKFYKNI